MKLPKIKTARYVVDLPKTGKIEYRPFLVREEGAILTALEFGNQNDLVATLKSVISDCIITKIDINEMLLIEFIYMVILLRTKSKSSKLTMVSECSECGKQFQFEIDLDTKEFFTNKDNIRLLIDIKGDLSIEIEAMKTALLDEYYKLEEASDKIDATLGLLSKIITKVIYEKKVFKDLDPEEVKTNILENLSSSEVENLTDKIGDIIKFEMRHDTECTHCGHISECVYDEPLSFLA